MSEFGLIIESTLKVIPVQNFDNDLRIFSVCGPGEPL